ncbi:RNA polymerase III RPC4-domain-containing protein [Phakopsora pachyrhizi]|uniref:RNA polymerase III RPC4-domain-containing protein n=1 Tax=Phakopsora pachyrhizi TaxID=170000 RepID=A0AAV0BL74_PHAPC|nr:RNA polymerase III RPC4-domain-containing protein [Phakopsora pachyrhizi]CAH7687464.1 RNA polymerase III RPC4-domain-containing protein [Phakopsora pachyrhizi]
MSNFGPATSGRARGTRGRGRGRGRDAHASFAVPDSDPTLDPLLQQLADIPVEAIGESSGSGPLASSSAPPRAATTAGSKFKPRIVKRVDKLEIKTESDFEPGDHAGRGRGRGRGRGADRGGRGRGEIVMTASGAFAMGPAEASRSGRSAQGPNQSGMRRIDNSATPVNGPSRDDTPAGTTEMSRNRETSELDLYSDLESNPSQEDFANEEGQSRGKNADLNEINLEHSMAPVSLPWDPKRIAEREKLLQERKLKVANIARMKLKGEEDGEDSKPSITTSSRASTAAVSSEALGRTSLSAAPESVARNDTLEEKDFEAMKNEIKLQQEQLEELSNVGKQLIGSSHLKVEQKADIQDNFREESENSPCPIYIFQFPRHFPTFFDPENPPQIKSDHKPVPGATSKLAKKKKPTLDDWMGWGKGGRRADYIGVAADEEEKSLQGQVGELVIRRSGRVQMIIGDVAYDVLRAAQVSFHQELAVIDPSPEGRLRAMYILGKTTQKFIAAPDVTTLLQREKRERKVKKE